MDGSRQKAEMKKYLLIGMLRSGDGVHSGHSGENVSYF